MHIEMMRAIQIDSLAYRDIHSLAYCGRPNRHIDMCIGIHFFFRGSIIGVYHFAIKLSYAGVMSRVWYGFLLRMRKQFCWEPEAISP
jgi:hypothetical protein